MMENDTQIYVNKTQIENVQCYVYVGQRYSARDKEIQRTIAAGCTAFTNHRDIFNNYIGTCLFQC